jgi:small-conductance mechanosensitive channel
MTELLHKYLGITASLQTKIFTTIFFIIIWWVFDRIFKKLIFEKIDDVTIRYQWQKTAKYSTVFLLLLFLSRIWFGAFDSIGTYFGLLSAGLAIAFQDLLVNLAGWVFILTRKPFLLVIELKLEKLEVMLLMLEFFNFLLLKLVIGLMLTKVQEE